jgi:hypothetical protein
VICPSVGDNRWKHLLIPHTLALLVRGKRFGARREEPAPHQVVGVVTAHQAFDGSLV